MSRSVTILLSFVIFTFPALGWTWHDETHIAIAKAAGYEKWFNAAGADMAKIKAGVVEKLNHYVDNPPGTIVNAKMVLNQVDQYNKSSDITGNLYGAILGSIREYRTTTLEGKYAEYHLAFCVHYVGDLSQPLHNTLYNAYNRQNHTATDDTINNEVLDDRPF